MFTVQRSIRTRLRGQAFAMLERVGTPDSRAIQIAFTKTGVLSTCGKLRNSETKATRSRRSLPERTINKKAGWKRIQPALCRCADRPAVTSAKAQEKQSNRPKQQYAD